MPGLTAISGNIHIAGGCLHSTVRLESTADADWKTDPGAQLGVRLNASRHQNHVTLLRPAIAFHRERLPEARDGTGVCAGAESNIVSPQFIADHFTQLRVNCRRKRGASTYQDDFEAAMG